MKIHAVCCLLLTAVSAGADFARYVDITTSYSGADVPDFPALVRISASNPDGFYSDVKHDGADLRFSDADGEGDYPFEIDTWDPNGDSCIWVKLPKLSAGMTFRMYYGDDGKTAPTAPAEVWSGYDLVCHVSGSANDSARPARQGVLNPRGASAPGMIGAAYGVSGTDNGAAMINQFYDWATSGGEKLADPEFSYSFWIRRTGDFAAWQPLVGPRNTANADCWGIGSTSATDGSTLYVWSTQSSKDSIPVPGGLPAGEWKKIDVVQNASGASLYVDGVLSGSRTFVSPNRSWPQWMGWGGAVQTGTFGATSQPSDFDECRIFSTLADSARIAADYATVKNADFLVFKTPRDNLGDPGGALVLH